MTKSAIRVPLPNNAKNDKHAISKPFITFGKNKRVPPLNIAKNDKQANSKPFIKFGKKKVEYYTMVRAIIYIIAPCDACQELYWI